VGVAFGGLVEEFFEDGGDGVLLAGGFCAEFAGEFGDVKGKRGFV